MPSLEWHQSIEKIKPHVVKISTPQGFGTGFLIYYSIIKPICAIATAAHVIEHAHHWMEPIRIDHFGSGKSQLLKEEDRAIIVDQKRDTASIVFDRANIPFPEQPFSLIPEKKSLKQGVQVGWLGFPAISGSDLCFFTGNISCSLKRDERYLVDGVAINGVSGGPTFHLPANGEIVLVGVVSAYIPNRATGESLPGLCVVTDVKQFQNDVKKFKSLDEAKREEKPSDPPGTPPPQVSGGEKSPSA